MWGSNGKGTLYHSVRYPPQGSSSPSLQAAGGCSAYKGLGWGAASSLARSGKTGGSRFSSVSIQIFPYQVSGSHYFSIRDPAFRIGDQLRLIMLSPLQFCHPYDSILRLIFCLFYFPGAGEEGFFKSCLWRASRWTKYNISSIKKSCNELKHINCVKLWELWVDSYPGQACRSVYLEEISWSSLEDVSDSTFILNLVRERIKLFFFFCLSLFFN